MKKSINSPFLIAFYLLHSRQKCELPDQIIGSGEIVSNAFVY